MLSVVDLNTRIPLGMVASVVTAVVGCALWIAAIQAKADTLQQRVEKMENVAEQLSDVKAKLAAMDYKIDFLVRTQGKPP